jgi:hypothetical protein
MQLQGVNINDNESLEKEADVMGGGFQRTEYDNLVNHNLINTKTDGVVQYKVLIDSKEINDDVLTECFIYALKSGEARLSDNEMKPFLNRSKTELSENGSELKDYLIERYNSSNINLNLTDKDSLSHQITQDINLYYNNDKQLIGIPHQHSEYAVDLEHRKPGHIGSKKKKRIGDDMRIYRCMPLVEWEEAKLSGHGGSLGEAMYYFRKNKGGISNVVIVEFKLFGCKLNDMMGVIKSGGEGAQSDEDTFGGKSESNAAFGTSEKFFSVDLAHASQIIKKKATSKVVAYTGEEPRSYRKSGQAWEKK